jgi:hypothetical protein
MTGTKLEAVLTGWAGGAVAGCHRKGGQDGEVPAVVRETRSLP